MTQYYLVILIICFYQQLYLVKYLITCSILRFKPAEPEELLKAFQLLDPENRGYIMKDDLEKSIMEIGEPFTKEEVADMMAVACDETGKINYEHYINLLIVRKNIDLFSICPKFFSIEVYILSKMVCRY